MFNWLLNFFDPPSPEKTAEDIMWGVARRSFDLFREKEFWGLFDEWEKMEQTEQDRIFNEIVLSGLSMIYLMLEDIEQASEGGKREMFRIVKNHFHGAYPRKLRTLGTEEDNVQMWYRLMAMRCEEYRKDYRRMRKYLPDASTANPWIPVVSIGGLHHIRRGKTSPEDQLFPMFQEWCTAIAMLCEKKMIRLMNRLS